ncbi:MAG: hypothetical protein AAGF95_25375 [Chloroflexota bacterium]
MISVNVQRCYKLLIWILITSLLTIGILTTSPTNAQSSQATWAAWHIKVDFSTGKPSIVWTSFVGYQSTVLDAIEHNLTNKCDIPQKLQITQGYAWFNGNTYLSCETPNFHDDINQLAPHLQIDPDKCICEFGSSPFWITADVKLNTINDYNPLFYKSDLAFRLPTFPEEHLSSSMMLQLEHGSIVTPSWPIDQKGNQVWLGTGSDYFVATSSQMGWSGFMETLFQGAGLNLLRYQVRDDEFAYWVEDSQSQSIVDPTYANLGQQGYLSLKTSPDIIYIGFDPTNKAFFEGHVRTLEIDPGCRAY